MPAARRANDLYRLVGRIVLREEFTAAAVRTFRFFPHGESPNPRRPSGQPLMRETPISGPVFAVAENASYSARTSILRGRISGRFGMRNVRTPSLRLASTLSLSSSLLSAKVRW